MASILWELSHMKGQCPCQIHIQSDIWFVCRSGCDRKDSIHSTYNISRISRLSIVTNLKVLRRNSRWTKNAPHTPLSNPASRGLKYGIYVLLTGNPDLWVSFRVCYWEQSRRKKPHNGRRIQNTKHRIPEWDVMPYKVFVIQGISIIYIQSRRSFPYKWSMD